MLVQVTQSLANDKVCQRELKSLVSGMEELWFKRVFIITEEESGRN